MAIHKATLAKEVNDVIEYIYPKTTSDIVEYTDGVSVYTKLSELDASVSSNATDVASLTTELSSLSSTVVVQIDALQTAVATNTSGVAYNKTEIDGMTEDISDINEAIDTINTRLSTLTSLSDGSTTGDAELADIRIDYNGTTYDSAGDAVRGQINEVIDMIGDLYTNKGWSYETIEVDGDTWGTEDGQEIGIGTSLSYLMGIDDSINDLKLWIKAKLMSVLKLAV